MLPAILVHGLFDFGLMWMALGVPVPGDSQLLAGILSLGYGILVLSVAWFIMVKRWHNVQALVAEVQRQEVEEAEGVAHGSAVLGDEQSDDEMAMLEQGPLMNAVV